jgi:DNA polymerase-1
MKKLFIIDASGYIYRSYFAIRNMTNSKGESTNALYGFLSSIRKLRKDFNPEHMVAVFDGPRGIMQRKQIYPEYKAHRSETPQDLRYQIEWAVKACELMGIPYLNVPEVEADDTMGSVAIWAEKHDALVYLCTSDKDLSQLVNEHIFLLNTFKENLILGVKEVEETYGVPPKQMIDFLAITGDTSDNVPGLPGFGPKTASALLKQFGSLDYILQHPEVVSGKKQETILKYGQKAILSRQLVTIHTAVDFPQDKDFFAIKSFDQKALREFYTSMNFNTLIRELEQAPAIQEEAPVPVIDQSIENHYHFVDDTAALSQLIEELSKHSQISMTTKTTYFEPIKAELLGISFSTSESDSWYIPLNGKLGQIEVLKKLKPIFENPAIGFFGHNVKFDMLVLENYGIKIASIIFDTMLASYLLNSHVRQHTLEQIVLQHFDKVKPLLTDILGKGKAAIPLSNFPPDKLTEYACDEALYIFRLKSIFESQLKSRNLQHVLNDLELPLLSVLAKMERAGIYLDIPCLQNMGIDIMKQINELEKTIYALAGETFNINSPKQLSEILFTKIGLKPPKKIATGHSTNADVLQALSHLHPLPAKIIEYRTLEKLRSTYIDTLPEQVYRKTNRIHCTFNQTVAATGRLSCQDPNLQNIPIRSEVGRKIRQAFRPEKEGWSYIAADYSQIELRLLAHLSGDPNLIKAFLNGEDIHKSTAAHIFGIPLSEVTKEMRYHAKAVNFGIVYGQQGFGLSQELGISVEDANKFIATYFKQYPRVKEYLEERKQIARETGRSVTYFGRERLIPEITSKNGQIRLAAERLAINTPLQGTAADLIKMAMLKIDARLKAENRKGYMILQIHDELIFEVPDEEIEEIAAIVKEEMQGVLALKVPLIVDISIGKNWAQC